MKPLTAPEMTFKITEGHRQHHSSLHPRALRTTDRRSRQHLFSDKIAEITFKMDQDDWRWHDSAGHTSLY